jgi:nucleoside-diphosphate-sugar epimerase
MTKLLLAGGAGFIGSPLAGRLLRRTDVTSPTGVDPRWTGPRETLALARIEDSCLRFVQGGGERLDADGPSDAIVPLASPGSPPWSTAEPLRTASAR